MNRIVLLASWLDGRAGHLRAIDRLAGLGDRRTGGEEATYCLTMANSLNDRNTLCGYL